MVGDGAWVAVTALLVAQCKLNVDRAVKPIFALNPASSSEGLAEVVVASVDVEPLSMRINSSNLPSVSSLA